MKQKKKTIIIIVLIICICSMIYSFYNIIKWKIDNDNSSALIEKLQEETSVKEIITDTAIYINSENKEQDSSYWYYAKMDLLNVDFNTLIEENSDTKGWIKVNGTKINYPFVQTKDNSYYLTHSIEKKYTDAGWIFLDYRNNIDKLEDNTIIYGHARLDKTMFGSLKNTLKKSWYDNKDNHVIKISTEKENTLWQIFSIYHIKTESYYITTSFNTRKDFQKYINKSLERSIYNFDSDIDINDKILTLSTCYGSDEKLVVQAKLIKKEVRN